MGRKKNRVHLAAQAYPHELDLMFFFSSLVGYFLFVYR